MQIVTWQTADFWREVCAIHHDSRLSTGKCLGGWSNGEWQHVDTDTMRQWIGFAGAKHHMSRPSSSHRFWTTYLHIFTYCLYVKKIQKSSNTIKNPQFKKQLNTSKLFPFALFSSPKDLNPGPCGILRLLRLHPAAMLGGKASQAAPNMKVAVRQPKKKDSADVIWKWWYYGWLIMVNLWLIPSP